MRKGSGDNGGGDQGGYSDSDVHIYVSVRMCVIMTWMYKRVLVIRRVEKRGRKKRE